jgi:hypothetical protein
MYLGDLHGNFIGQYIDRFGIKYSYHTGRWFWTFKSFIKESRELELYHKKLVKTMLLYML